MKKEMLASANESVSQVALGCMLMGSVIGKRDSFNILDEFIDIGGNFLDTANCYAWWIGNGENIGDESENMLGNWMKERKNRDKVFLATKGGARLKNPKEVNENVIFEGNAAPIIRKAVENSLKRLQTDYIDLYYIHIDDRITPLEETLEILNDLIKEGKIKNIACSNFRTWRLERSRNLCISKGWKPFIAIQQQYSYFRPRVGTDFGVDVHADDELMDYLRDNRDITLLAYSPLLKGIYDDKEKRESKKDWWKIFDTDDSEKRLKALTELAKELGVTNNQLVLAWLIYHEPKVIPLVGFSNAEQYRHNIQCVNIHLTPEQVAFLNTYPV